ncbi:extracellular glycoprotein lacritin isoform X1 [Tupaia chinensis]|uniref:extracellular glycoprotein lacritin isoform X1 n=1 Tax=Tupaia chinensis TaxID=246437 RepID=UPI0003C91671|nr:extracellular glycoprotein lacritin isoform X1 [Tupaia chinensis]
MRFTDLLFLAALVGTLVYAQDGTSDPAGSAPNQDSVTSKADEVTSTSEKPTSTQETVTTTQKTSTVAPTTKRPQRKQNQVPQKKQNTLHSIIEATGSQAQAAAKEVKDKINSAIQHGMQLQKNVAKTAHSVAKEGAEELENRINEVASLGGKFFTGGANMLTNLRKLSHRAPKSRK